MIGSTERTLSRYVNWTDYAGEEGEVVLQKGGGVFMLIALDGLPFETTPDEMINHRYYAYEAALRHGSQDGLTYGFLQCRGEADPAIYPVGEFRTEFAAGLDRKYRHRLFGTRSMWLNRTYLYVQLTPRRFDGTLIRSLLPSMQSRELPHARIERLRRIVSILCEQLKPCSPRVQRVVWRNGRPFSEIAEAIAFAMTGFWRQVPLSLSGAAAVFSETFIVGGEEFEIRMPHRSTFGACLNMHDFPTPVGPGIFDGFLSASYRHTIYHGFECLPPVVGETMLMRRQNKMKAAGDRALSQAAELTAAANEVASNRMSMGQYAFAMTLFCDRREALPETVLAAYGDLGTGGIKVEREDLALEAVLFSPIPGNFDLRGREAGVSSRNFAAFASPHNYPMGERKGQWGAPFALFRTNGGSPFRFHLHSGGSGNCYVSGRTRSGKSTGMGFLVCQAERSGAQIVIYDKDRGLEVLVRALEGSYLSLTNAPGTGSGLAPLRRLSDSPEDLDFLAALIRACCATPAPYNFTAEENRRLPIALRHVMRLPPEERYMEEVRAFLGTSRDGAGARLETWCWGQERGWVVDCQHDIVNLDSHVIGFDQTKILDDPIAVGAVLSTLFHYTGKLVDGRRLMFVLDEVWNSLRIPAFHGAIKNGLKTFGKYIPRSFLARKKSATD